MLGLVSLGCRASCFTYLCDAGFLEFFKLWRALRITLPAGNGRGGGRSGERRRWRGWIDTPDRSASSVSRAVQDAWDVFWDELGVVPPEVVDALQGAVSRSSVDDFWSSWSNNAEALPF